MKLKNRRAAQPKPSEQRDNAPAVVSQEHAHKHCWTDIPGRPNWRECPCGAEVLSNAPIP